MSAARASQCDVLAERLSAALAGDLDAAECRRLKAHARACPRCARLAKDLERATVLCRRAGAEPLPAEVRRRARARLRALLGQPPSKDVTLPRRRSRR
jgi:anti-sigma factor RsiW